MFRTTGKILFGCLLSTAAGGGAWLVCSHGSVQRELQKQRERNQKLQLIVERLGSERRVGDIIVTDQASTGDGVRTTLLFVEYCKDGSPLPARKFMIEGKQAHIDAMVIKFDGRFVQENDPLRGHSIALFTRLYGEHQSPAAGFAIDAPGDVPEVYRNANADVARFEKALWANFWKLADDPAYRTSMGVRVAQGEGVWRTFEPGWLYTLTLESNGGINITPEPLKGIYREALNNRGAAPSAGVTRTE